MPYFRAFSAFSVTATNFMNSITFVMNHLISYFDISICHCSNRTLCYHLFKFHGFNYGYFLGGVCSIQLSYWDIFKIYAIFIARRNRTICRLGGACYIHLTMGTNAVFSGFFSLFGHGNQLYELNHFRDESSDFLFRHFYMPLFKSDSLLPPF